MSETQRKAALEEEEEGEERRKGEEVGGESARVGGVGPPAASSAAVEEEEPAAAVFYKTKVVEFLGRSTPIILQNDNGPCPLLAICNALLLRNNINLSLDTSEVSQQKLLSLVAERLLDSNSNVEGKDEGYIKNQQRNISDAIDLLPRLASGIDVNVLFRKVNDFEFTPECAIFDLLDIGLYHGWIVDPQDMETATAIGSKSYNALVGELVAHDTRNPEGERHLIEDSSVDFAAATTAALGVPSPCLSRSMSCSDPPISVTSEHRVRRGDLEEEAELMRVLNLSRAEQAMPVIESLSRDTNLSGISSGSEESTLSKISEAGAITGISVAHNDIPENSTEQELLVSSQCNKTCDLGYNKTCLTGTEMETDKSYTSTAVGGHSDCSEGAGAILTSSNSTTTAEPDSLTQGQIFCFHSLETDNSFDDKCLVNGSGEDQCVSQKGVQKNSTSQDLEHANNLSDDNSAFFTSQESPSADFHSSSGRKDTTGDFSLNPNEIEPLYEGEECILDSAPPDFDNHEPVYEGEVILAKQADQGEEFVHVPFKDTTSQQQWHAIRSFLKDNASQLTVYGLFSLQEGLKERELCVFFRNNHFSTMFKYNGELYLLATDQGYINQQDLVWEKLNEVNGDTMFMTGSFKEFTAGNQASHSWDEQNAINEYLALEGSSSGNTTFNSDHQLAMELQKQEFEKQPQGPQRQQPQKLQQSSGSDRSRLVTGPQVSRHSSNPSQKLDSKSKDKCVLM